MCGARATGVIATRKIEDIVAAKPDCVLYMPATNGTSIDDICTLLDSGANIVTLVADFHHRDSLDPDVRQRIEAAW